LDYLAEAAGYQFVLAVTDQDGRTAMAQPMFENLSVAFFLLGTGFALGYVVRAAISHYHHEQIRRRRIS
jgi:hypothetical protein